MTSYIKALVSSNRRRLKTDSIDGTKKFDLDLTYIVKDRIIAMGWPGRGSETIYRNDINADKTKNLSARGSKKIPKRLTTLNFLAK